MKFRFLTTMIVNFEGFWVATPCSLVEMPASTLKMEVVTTPETSVPL